MLDLIGLGLWIVGYELGPCAWGLLSTLSLEAFHDKVSAGSWPTVLVCVGSRKEIDKDNSLLCLSLIVCRSSYTVLVLAEGRGEPRVHPHCFCSSRLSIVYIYRGDFFLVTFAYFCCLLKRKVQEPSLLSGGAGLFCIAAFSFLDL